MRQAQLHLQLCGICTPVDLYLPLSLRMHAKTMVNDIYVLCTQGERMRQTELRVHMQAMRAYRPPSLPPYLYIHTKGWVMASIDYAHGESG